MGILQRLKSTPLWLLLPAVAVAAVLGMAVSGYVPLMFDPSLYESNQAQAAELATVDAEALEAEGSEHVGDSVAAGELTDGTYTGYAACGMGNADDWKPYYVAVTIQVEGGKVTIVGIAGSSTGHDGESGLAWDAAENQQYLDRAISGGVQSQLQSQLDASGTISGVDTVSGATYSSTAIYNALADALAQAGGASAGSMAAPVAEQADTSKTVAADAAPESLADGTWVGYAACGQGNSDNWSPYYVAVTVLVKNGKVVRITKIEGTSTDDAGSKALSWNALENKKYLNWAIDGRNSDQGVKTQMNNQLKASGSVSGIDTVSGATYSSEAIFKAYSAALRKSSEAASSGKSGSSSKADKAGKTGNSKKSDSKSDSKKTGKTSTKEKVGALEDGTWTGYDVCGPDPVHVWNPYYIGVTITVKNGKVTAVKKIFASSTGAKGDPKLKWDAAENGDYYEGALAGTGASIKQSVKAGKVPTSVDTVSGATFSSKSIFNAFYAALKKSAAAGGLTISVPDPDDDAAADDGTGDGTGDSPQGGTGDNPSEGGSGDGNDATDDEPEQEIYYGYALCDGSNGGWASYYVVVGVTATDGVPSTIAKAYGDADGAIDSSLRYSAAENSIYLNWAVDGKFGGVGYRMKSVVKQIQDKLDAGAEPTRIDTVSGATISSRALFNAYKMAAANAAAGVGKTPAEAVAVAAAAGSEG